MGRVVERGFLVFVVFRRVTCSPFGDPTVA